MGVEGGAELRLRGEARHVAEPLLGERPVEGVDLGADLLDLGGRHVAPQRRASAVAVDAGRE